MRATGRGGIPRGWRRGPAGPVVRLAAAVLLLGVAAVGTVARGVTSLSGLVLPVTTITGVAAEAGCLVLTVALILQARRQPPSGKDSSGTPESASWWARIFSTLMLLAFFALAGAVALVTFGGDQVRRINVAPLSVVPVLGHAGGPEHSSGAAGTTVLVLAAVMVLVLSVVAVAVIWLRRRTAAALPRSGVGSSPLAAAVAAGSSAFNATAGVREAIIACYAAMEDTLAVAGSPRRAADTPEELLDRAMRNGVIRTQAAQRLTALFREARFSPHELAETQQQLARASLADISHDLSDAS
jgi:hypothetical protein